MSEDEDIVLEQPLPDPGWRGALGRRLGAAFAPPSRPARLGHRIGGLTLAGGILLLVAVTQV
ncbi:MAG: hypothetical protein QOH62_3535 [Solirubrobacteraceae bacterium]|nr:hypothetical protein [Solirubrobacteraceae bacterium]